MDNYDNIIEDFIKSKILRRRFNIALILMIFVLCSLVISSIIQGIIYNRNLPSTTNIENSSEPSDSTELITNVESNLDNADDQDSNVINPEIELIQEDLALANYTYQNFNECGVEMPILNDSSWQYNFYSNFIPIKYITTGASVRDSNLGTQNDNPNRNLTIGCGIAGEIDSLDKYFSSIASFFSELNLKTGNTESPFNIALLAKETHWNQEVYKVMISGGMGQPTVNYLAIHSGLLYKITALGEAGNQEVNEIVDIMFKNLKFNKVKVSDLRKTCTSTYYKISFVTPIDFSCNASDVSTVSNNSKYYIIMRNSGREAYCVLTDSSCKIEEFFRTGNMILNKYSYNGSFIEIFGYVQDSQITGGAIWIAITSSIPQNPPINKSDKTINDILNSIKVI